MAITKTQIARQLYRVGGVGGRAEEGPVERGGMSNRDRGREESMKEAQRKADLRNITNRIRDDKIEEDLEQTLQRLRKLGDICRYMANTLNQVSYRITLKVCRQIFERCRTLVYKYRLV